MLVLDIPLILAFCPFVKALKANQSKSLAVEEKVTCIYLSYLQVISFFLRLYQ